LEPRIEVNPRLEPSDKPLDPGHFGLVTRVRRQSLQASMYHVCSHQQVLFSQFVLVEIEDSLIAIRNLLSTTLDPVGAFQGNPWFSDA
jgi:hypothetical protein